jgi:hypothetical protein
MLEPKTHFEQVPLEIVRKIVEEQILRETATAQDQMTKKKVLEEGIWGKQEQPMVRSRTFSPVELWKQS